MNAILLVIAAIYAANACLVTLWAVIYLVLFGTPPPKKALYRLLLPFIWLFH